MRFLRDILNYESNYKYSKYTRTLYAVDPDECTSLYSFDSYSTLIVYKVLFIKVYSYRSLSDRLDMYRSLFASGALREIL